MRLKEAELKKQVWDYLQYQMNLGKLYFDRLNSGAIYEKRGDKTYGVQLCREGTADFFILQRGGCWDRCRLLFVELKGDKGKQSDKQKEFQALVETQGAVYSVVRSVEELMELL